MVKEVLGFPKMTSFSRMRISMAVNGMIRGVRTCRSCFLAALQNSKFISKWGYVYTIFKCFLTGNALEMLCLNRFLFRKDNLYPYFCKMSSWNFLHRGPSLLSLSVPHAVLVPGFYLFNFNVFIRE